MKHSYLLYRSACFCFRETTWPQSRLRHKGPTSRHALTHNRGRQIPRYLESMHEEKGGRTIQQHSSLVEFSYGDV